ncbi:MAG: AhpC/TSA family protein [Bacteroidetes bacterium]|nr:AhpC/TSA family protein [Bacteroidota bacterium]
MKKIITYSILLFTISFCYGQSDSKLVAEKENFLIKGTIKNYENQTLYLYRCYGDSLLIVDTMNTGKNGEFDFPSIYHGKRLLTGMYKISLPNNQFFYIIYDKQFVEIKTLYQPNNYYNIAFDSIMVLSSTSASHGAEINKHFYEYQSIQQKLNIAGFYLLEMMRTYPFYDPFHKKIEDEYIARYTNMENFMKNPSVAVNKDKQKESSKKQQSNQSLITDNKIPNIARKIDSAYFIPIFPDWKQSDPWRDSVVALHYFDYFNPADSFFLQTNILPEKIDLYIILSTNKRDEKNELIKDETLVTKAAQAFLEKVKSNNENFLFCLRYILAKLDKEKHYTSLLTIYERYVKTEDSNCNPSSPQFDWIRKKADILKHIQIDSVAPDFNITSVDSNSSKKVIGNDTLKMHNLQSDYTLLVFWATWCPHCTQALPEIKKLSDEFNVKGDSKKTSNVKVAEKLITVAISLDSDSAQWRKFIADNNLSSFMNTSELKGWKGEVPIQYNVYATPTILLLDKDKKIIYQTFDVKELSQKLDEIKKKLK